MAKKTSGGLVLYNLIGNSPRFLVAHPGGPFFRKRDEGWWSIPKGEPEEGEEIFDAAIREFEEETGLCPEGPYIGLGTIVQKSGKRVHAWAFEGEWEDGKQKGPGACADGSHLLVTEWEKCVPNETIWELRPQIEFIKRSPLN